MNMDSIKEMSNKELVDTYKDTKKKLAKMRFQSVISALEKPHLLKETRKDIARMAGEINNRRKAAEFAAFEKSVNEG